MSYCEWGYSIIG